MSNAKTIENLYAAFGRGDIAAILEPIAPDIIWEYGDNSTDVPWLQPRRGKDQIAGFFQLIAKELEIHSFVFKGAAEGGNVVVAMVDVEATVRRTGKKIVELDEAHIWHFDDRGRIVKFRHRVDTALQQKAWSTGS